MRIYHEEDNIYLVARNKWDDMPLLVKVIPWTDSNGVVQYQVNSYWHVYARLDYLSTLKMRRNDETRAIRTAMKMSRKHDY